MLSRIGHLTPQSLNSSISQFHKFKASDFLSLSSNLILINLIKLLIDFFHQSKFISIHSYGRLFLLGYCYLSLDLTIIHYKIILMHQHLFNEP